MYQYFKYNDCLAGGKNIKPKSHPLFGFYHTSNYILSDKYKPLIIHSQY